MKPKGAVLGSITKAIVEGIQRNQEVYDAIGSSRLMGKYEELISAVEAGNFPHPYYVKSNPYNPLAPAPPRLTIQDLTKAA